MFIDIQTGDVVAEVFSINRRGAVAPMPRDPNAASGLASADETDPSVKSFDVILIVDCEEREVVSQGGPDSHQGEGVQLFCPAGSPNGVDGE